MIRYEETKIGNNSIMVFVDGVLAGHIVRVPDGYQYVVKGGKNKGKIFETIHQVKESLEGEE